MHVQEHFASLLTQPLATDDDGAFGRLHTAPAANFGRVRSHLREIDSR